MPDLSTVENPVAVSAQPTAGAVDFANLLSGTQNDVGYTPNATPYVPAPGSDASVSSAYDRAGLGLPNDIDSYVIPPGLENTTASLGDSPVLSSVQGIYDGLKNDVSGAITTVSNATKAAFTGVTNVGGNIVNATKSAITSTLWWIVLLVGGLFVGLYFLGKSGLVGQAASVR